MKAISKLVMVLTAMVLTISANAQVNTGTSPFAGSTHNYHVDQSTLATTLTWSVVGATEGDDYSFVGGKVGEDVQIKWITASVTPYVLTVEEKRNDLVLSLAGCPTTRTIDVTVVGNTFDVYAELVTTSVDADACATVDNPVDDLGVLGSNADDVFGKTERTYKVRAFDLPLNSSLETIAWNYTYSVSHTEMGNSTNTPITVSILVDGVPSANGSTINIAKADLESTIVVSYLTNDKKQDVDLDLKLEITAASDALGTLDSNTKGGVSNEAIFIVRAMPATTGITTD